MDVVGVEAEEEDEVVVGEAEVVEEEVEVVEELIVSSMSIMFLLMS